MKPKTKILTLEQAAARQMDHPRWHVGNSAGFHASNIYIHNGQTAHDDECVATVPGIFLNQTVAELTRFMEEPARKEVPLMLRTLPAFMRGRLIAAAPSMRTALKLALPHLEKLQWLPEETPHNKPTGESYCPECGGYKPQHSAHCPLGNAIKAVRAALDEPEWK